MRLISEERVFSKTVCRSWVFHHVWAFLLTAYVSHECPRSVREMIATTSDPFWTIWHPFLTNNQILYPCFVSARSISVPFNTPERRRNRGGRRIFVYHAKLLILHLSALTLQFKRASSQTIPGQKDTVRGFYTSQEIEFGIAQEIILRRNLF